MVTTFLLLLLASFYNNSVESLNILGVFPFQARSHWFVFEKYLQSLAEKGHNVTVISHFPREEIIPNYHDINLAGEKKGAGFEIDISYRTMIKSMEYVVKLGVESCKQLLENESVQELWKSKRKFDLVVMEYFNTDCVLGLAYELEAPVVGMTTNDLLPWHYNIFGIPFNPSYVPFILSGGLQPSLFERVEKTVLNYIFNSKYQESLEEHEKILSKYFDDLPSLEELNRRTKFLLLYHNFVISGYRLLPPNVIEVGGCHVMPAKPLSADLLKFINESPHGVIYISFGSMVNELSLPKHKLDAILDAIADLPQRVIWKWNSEMFPGDSKNIYLSRWFQQNDLLAHPKVMAFLSHGGHLSMTEAVYHGVPMVIMPVFGDQPANADAVDKCGLGVQITFNDLTKDNLLNKFRTVLDSEFRASVKNLSRAFNARPVSAMDSAIFWTEFAAKHSLRVRNPVADVPLYQYLCLDVIAVIVTSIIICLLVLIKSVRGIFLLYFYVTRKGNWKDKVQ